MRKVFEYLKARPVRVRLVLTFIAGGLTAIGYGKAAEGLRILAALFAQ